jgi:hypothetical protein
MREKSSAWRHAGFVPKVSNYDSSLEGLQLYHDCLSAILVNLEDLQAKPPIVLLNLGGGELGFHRMAKPNFYR